MKLMRFVLCSLCAALIMHLGWSCLMASIAASYYAQRMPNIRHLDQEPSERFALATAFLRHADGFEEPTIVFFGSSLTYGYPFARSLTDAVQEELPARRVVNASTIGASLDMVRQHVMIAAENDLHFETIVLEIPYVNTLSGLSHGLPSSAELKRRADGERRLVRSHEGSSYLSFYCRLPWGPHHVAVLRDDYARCEQEIEYAVGIVPDDYLPNRERFKKVKQRYQADLHDLLMRARTIADRVCVFVSPVHLRGAQELGFNAEALLEQIRFTEQACSEVEGVEVLQLGANYLDTRKYYCNVTHLNLRGSDAFGRWIAQSLRVTDGSAEAIADTRTSQSASRRR